MVHQESGVRLVLRQPHTRALPTVDMELRSPCPLHWRLITNGPGQERGQEWRCWLQADYSASVSRKGLLYLWPGVAIVSRWRPEGRVTDVRLTRPGIRLTSGPPPPPPPLLPPPPFPPSPPPLPPSSSPPSLSSPPPPPPPPPSLHLSSSSPPLPPLPPPPPSPPSCPPRRPSSKAALTPSQRPPPRSQCPQRVTSSGQSGRLAPSGSRPKAEITNEPAIPRTVSARARRSDRSAGWLSCRP